ncbi:CotH kinase family protein [Desulfosporosinus nitroreducens]|uniref:CotH kinase family protein n=1 Tax=Desulfosporosinus nitroreducens TaxID=2018668 RepID=UPI0034593634
MKLLRQIWRVESFPSANIQFIFKLPFDEYIDNQTLAGLSKINLNNMYSDASYLREFGMR